MAFKRLICNDVTEALVKAAEGADSMKHVVILYAGKDGEADGMVCDNGISVQGTNWLLDELKTFLLNRHVVGE